MKYITIVLILLSCTKEYKNPPESVEPYFFIKVFSDSIKTNSYLNMQSSCAKFANYSCNHLIWRTYEGNGISSYTTVQIKLPNKSITNFKGKLMPYWDDVYYNSGDSFIGNFSIFLVKIGEPIITREYKNDRINSKFYADIHSDTITGNFSGFVRNVKNKMDTFFVDSVHFRVNVKR